MQIAYRGFQALDKLKHIYLFFESILIRISERWLISNLFSGFCHFRVIPDSLAKLKFKLLMSLKWLSFEEG